MKYLNNIDFSKNQALNMKLQNVGSLPGGLGAGDAGLIYFDTSDNRFHVWNGTTWSNGGIIDLTGLNTELVGVVVASDTVLEAFGKLEHRVNLNDAKVTNTDTQLNDIGVTSKVLTGLNVGTSGNVVATDTILAAIGRLENRVNTNDGKVSDINHNIWIANALDTAGYVAAPNVSTINQVWKTDASGNPEWRDDVDTNTQLSNAQVIGSLLTGFAGFGSVSTVAAADSIYTAFSKLEHRVNINDSKVTQLSNTGVISKILTDLNTGSGGTVAAADSILVAIGKLENRVALNDVKVTNTDNQLTNAQVIASTLDGFVASTGTVVATDSILEGLQRLEGRVALNDAKASDIDHNTDSYASSLGFNTGDGVLTIGRTGEQSGDLTADLDGRFSLLGHDHTGTSSQTFQIDDGNTGPKLKNVAGEMQVRNAGDSDYADLRIRNLYTEGPVTEIVSNEVNIGDSEILLNADITTNATNSNGGFAIKRLQVGDVGRGDAKVYFDNTSGLWSVIDGPVAAPTTFALARKLTQLIGDNAATSIAITHNLNTQDVVVSIREAGGSFEEVYANVEITDVNTITVKFAVAPTLNEYKVTVIG